MKSIPKILFGLLGLGLFALLNHAALAEDYHPHTQRTASDEDNRREEIRQRRRQASLREVEGLRQRRDAMARTAPSQPRREESRPSNPPPRQPDHQQSRPARGKHGN